MSTQQSIVQISEARLGKIGCGILGAGGGGRHGGEPIIVRIREGELLATRKGCLCEDAIRTVGVFHAITKSIGDADELIPVIGEGDGVALLVADTFDEAAVVSFEKNVILVAVKNDTEITACIKALDNTVLRHVGNGERAPQCVKLCGKLLVGDQQIAEGSKIGLLVGDELVQLMFAKRKLIFKAILCGFVLRFKVGDFRQLIVDVCFLSCEPHQFLNM